MARIHYIVRLSKRALVPGRSLTFRRGPEVPASIREIRANDADEADQIVSSLVYYDGDQATVTKVHRDGHREVIIDRFTNNGFASPEERQRLDIGDILDFVARLAATGNQEARDLLAKHDGSSLAKGA